LICYKAIEQIAFKVSDLLRSLFSVRMQAMTVRIGNGAARRFPPFAKVQRRLRLPQPAHRQVSALPVSRSAILVDVSDHIYRQFVHELLSLSALHGAIRDGIASRVDLGGIQHTILQSVRHLGQEGPVAVRDVAHHLGLSGAFITIETAKLQDRGLLEKRQSTADRRKVLLILTKKAHALFERVAPIQRSIGDVQFGCLSARQFRQLAPTITQLLQTSRDALLLLPHLERNGGKKKTVRRRQARTKAKRR
jgi:DNA-binding MarR family transcriptional regulator